MRHNFVSLCVSRPPIQNVLGVFLCQFFCWYVTWIAQITIHVRAQQLTNYMDEVTLRKNYLSTAITALQKAAGLNVSQEDEDKTYKAMIYLLQEMMKKFYSGNQQGEVK